MPSDFRRNFIASAPALLLACGILLLSAFELWRSHTEATKDAERNVENLVTVLSEQTIRSIQAIDANLQGIVAGLENQPNLLDNDAQFRAGLRTRLRTLPYARAFYVIGADGFITHDTDYPSTPRVSLADRPYFAGHVNDPAPDLHIGPPLQSRSLGIWFVSLSRRIDHADGSFAGVAVAAIEPLYFEQFYRQLWVGGGTIALFLADGTLLARSPRDDDVAGTSFSEAEPFKSLLASRTQDVYWMKSPVDGVDRVVGHKALEGLPLVLLVALNQDDAMRHWRAHATVVVVGASILLALLAVLEWLSRYYRKKEARSQLRLAEGQRLEAIGRFTGGVVHDVGHLLRVVRSAVLLLRPQAADRPAAQQLLDQIDDTLNVGGDLINQLLYYARAGGSEPQAVDVNTLIAESLPLFQRAAGPLVDIQVAYSRASAAVLTDVSRFQAVLLNLVLNARDAMARRGNIAIAVRTYDDANGRDWVEISVSDKGVGMDKETLSRAFDPFFTTKASGGGNGLGLSQVRTFVEHNQGEFAIDSTPEKGTTIWLHLPAAK